MKHLAWVVVAMVSLFGRSAYASETTEPGRARVAEQQRLLSSLWVFASLNYLYCDVIGLMDPKMHAAYESGEHEGFTVNENVLLAGTLLMQVPLSMTFLSTTLEPRASRIANISAGAFMTVVQSATLALGKPTSYYLASSVAEIATTSFITIYALFYMKPPKIAPAVEASREHVAARASIASKALLAEAAGALRASAGSRLDDFELDRGPRWPATLPAVTLRPCDSSLWWLSVSLRSAPAVRAPSATRTTVAEEAAAREPAAVERAGAAALAQRARAAAASS
jgi:hypothetical protein